MNDLHPTSRRVLQFIARYKAMQGGNSPTQREIEEAIGIVNSAVRYQIDQLVGHGLLRHQRGRARGLVLTLEGEQLVGRIADLRETGVAVEEAG